jgi:hypothetical protein
MNYGDRIHRDLGYILPCASAISSDQLQCRQFDLAALTKPHSSTSSHVHGRSAEILRCHCSRRSHSRGDELVRALRLQLARAYVLKQCQASGAKDSMIELYDGILSTESFDLSADGQSINPMKLLQRLVERSAFASSISGRGFSERHATSQSNQWRSSIPSMVTAMPILSDMSTTSLLHSARVRPPPCDLPRDLSLLLTHRSHQRDALFNPAPAHARLAIVERYPIRVQQLDAMRLLWRSFRHAQPIRPRQPIELAHAHSKRV